MEFSSKEKLLINGPRTLTVHEDYERGIKLYIFGEMHGKENSCPYNKTSIDINDYLTKVFESTEVEIDFYLESFYHTKESDYRTFYFQKDRNYDNDTSYMYRLRRSQCMIYDHMPMVISHHVDPRDNNSTLFDKLRDARSIENIFEIVKRIHEKMETLHMYKSYVLSILRDKNNIIGKEVSGSYMKNKIEDFIIRKLNNPYNIYYKAFKKISTEESIVKVTEKAKFGEDPSIVYKNLREYSVVLGMWEFDAYTLAKMFKLFEPEDIYSDVVMYPKNIIFYGGDNHSKIIREFLEENEFIATKSLGIYKKDGDEYSRCIDASELNYQLF
jgi:hypothetical protein